MTTTIACWNVNSVKARLPLVLRWLEETAPDIACLQELKCVDDAFPRSVIEDLGYHIETHGQKTYNGVALLSKMPAEDVQRGIPNFADEQARYIEAVYSVGTGAVRVASLYAPNGNGEPPKYEYKLNWMAALSDHLDTLLPYEEHLVLAGDYNVIATDADCYDPAAWEGDALYRPETRAAFRTLLNKGMCEAIAETYPLSGRELGEDSYTFWDYQAGAWRKNNGIRIDHHLLSPRATDAIIASGIDKDWRGEEKPSDHVPVWVELDIG
ncbi:MAG: exodeoxyribonuclease III [Alphaproteobacteria bacterium]|nr:exodeoxyribonuclease III [Alphaproteobacteria bacterium]